MDRKDALNNQVCRRPFKKGAARVKKSGAWAFFVNEVNQNKRLVRTGNSACDDKPVQSHLIMQAWAHTIYPTELNEFAILYRTGQVSGVAPRPISMLFIQKGHDAINRCWRSETSFPTGIFRCPVCLVKIKSLGR